MHYASTQNTIKIAKIIKNCKLINRNNFLIVLISIICVMDFHDVYFFLSMY